jgi:hypothetical protein
MKEPPMNPRDRDVRAPRAAALAALAAGVLAWGPRPAAAEGPQPTLPQVIDAIAAHHAGITSLMVAYGFKAEPLVAPQYLRRFLRMEYLCDEQRTFAFKGVKRYQRMVSPPMMDALIDPDEPAAGAGPTTPQERAAREQFLAATKVGRQLKAPPRKIEVGFPDMTAAFDGKTLRRTDKRTQSADIIDISSLDRDDGWFNPDYLWNLGFYLPDAINPARDRGDDRLPDALSRGAYRIEPKAEPVDGVACLVVSWPGHRKYWLDPAARYTVRKMEAYDPGTGLLTQRRRNFDLTRVAPGVWLPKRCWLEVCGPPSAPPPFRGAPLNRYVTTVTKVSVNDVPDSLFLLSIPPGTRVFDQSASITDGGRKKMLSYLMPADPSRLDQAIADARDEVAEKGSQSRRRYWFLVVNATVLIAVTVAVSGYRILRRRRGGP